MNKPGKDFSTRYAAAKRHRDAVRPLIEQVFRFCAPDRQKDFTINQMLNPGREETDTFTSIGEELATDLAGDLVTYYLPPEARWCEYEVIAPIPEDQADAVTELVQQREDDLFALIQSSNLADISPALMFETATHGTPAIWVDVNHIQQPIFCEVVPPHELLVTPGHLGILDRFREKVVYAQHLESTLQSFIAAGEVDLSDPLLRQKMQKPSATVTLCWGFWLDWSDPGNPLWRCEITVDGKRVTPADPVILGPMAGTCPLLVGRFNPRPGRAWGRGPGIKALPDFRTLDTLTDTVLSGLDQSLMNTIIYPDDGFIDLSNGIVAGTAIPAHRGFTRDQIYDLSRNVNVDQGFFTEERFEDKLRAAFYQDGPRQRGDTPPTAAQWLDERRRVQQRLGKPSAPMWTEMIYPLVQRFEYLAVQLGKMEEAITHNGQAISVVPLSPLQKAQNQDKVMVTRSNLEMLATFIPPEALSQVVDVVGTGKEIVRASGDELLKFIDQQQGAPIAPAPPAQ